MGPTSLLLRVMARRRPFLKGNDCNVADDLTSALAMKISSFAVTLLGVVVAAFVLDVAYAAQRPRPRRPPTRKPRRPPTKPPTPKPRRRPRKPPTTRPLPKPPTKKPTRFPTPKPTTKKPTSAPTANPTSKPKTKKPTSAPTANPTSKPKTKKPTSAPTANPTSKPTYVKVTCPGVGTTLSYGGRLYAAVTGGRYSWNDANALAQTFACCGSAGSLVTISSSAVNDFIHDNFGLAGNSWIGLNDKAMEGTFVWASGEAVTYTNWNSGEPNDYVPGEDCTEITGSTGKWNDAQCSGLRGAIVEFDCLNPKPTPAPTANPTSKPTYEKVTCRGVGTTLGYGGRLYTAVTGGRYSWNDANALAQTFACCGSAGSLVTISSSAVNDFIHDNFGLAGNCWIGLNDIAKEGTFVWASGEAATYTNWNSGEPNDYVPGEDCTEITGSTGKWNDAQCSGLRGAIVEFDCLNPKPTPAPTANPTSKPTYEKVTCPGVGTTLSYGGSLYAAVTGGRRYSWNDANALAQTFACCGSVGSLASIRSSAENDFIHRNFGLVGDSWIGFNDVAKEGTFVWASGEAVTYTNWNSGEPNDLESREDCTVISGSTGKWNDAQCSGFLLDAYIVEFDCPTPKPTSAPTANPTSKPTYDVVACPVFGTLSFGGRLYAAVTGGRYSWLDANALAQTFACCGSAGSLVTISSSAVNDFIHDNFGLYGDSWIGLNDFATEGTFVWASGEAVTYTNWNSGEPNDYVPGEDCTMISGSTGKWNDAECSFFNRLGAFIVEFDCVNPKARPPTTTTTPIPPTTPRPTPTTTSPTPL